MADDGDECEKMKSKESMDTTKSNMADDEDGDYILNPKTNRRVKKTGVIGRQLLQQRQLDTLQHPTDQTTVQTAPKKKSKRRPRPISERPSRIPVMNDAGLMCISVVTKQGNWLGLSLAHFVDGMRQIRSALSECHPEYVDTINKTFFHILGAVMLLKKRSKSVTLGCLRDIKWTTWTDKSNISNIDILRTFWLQILPRVCLGRDRASLPYWSSRYDEVSAKLWLPKGIGCPDSDTNSSNESWDSEDAQSWFVIKTKTKPLNSDLSTMSSASCMSTLAESMGEEDVNKKSDSDMLMRCVRLFPPAPIADIFMSYVTCSRVNYNKCLYHERHVAEREVLPVYTMVNNGYTANYDKPLCGGISQRVVLGKTLNCSEYELRTKFVNESIVEREVLPVYIVNNGYTANYDKPLCGGFTQNVFRGNKKAKGKMLGKIPNPDISPWMINIPKEVRHSGVHDYFEAKNTSIANLKAGNIRSFKMTYRKKGNRKYPSVNVGSNLKTQEHGKYMTVFPQKLASTEAGPNGVRKRKGGGRVYTSRILVSKNDRDFMHTQSQTGFRECRLKYSYGRWYLLVPYNVSYTKPPKPKTKPKMTPPQLQHSHEARPQKAKSKSTMAKKEPVCEPIGMAAIDPGARTFATVYDGDRVFTIQHDRNRMNTMQARLDKLQSLRAKKEITSRSYLRGCRRIRRKWNSLMADMHWKLASVLVGYKAVGLPSFQTQDMVKGNGLFKGTKRELLGLQHGQFRNRLRHKARGRTHILTVDESFTTKTCTQCGNIRNMGGLEVYKCRKCHLNIGRDVGSARSIFMCTMLLRMEKQCT
jgi:transposase